MIIHGIAIFLNMILLPIPLLVPCNDIMNSLKDLDNRESTRVYESYGYESNRNQMQQVLSSFLTLCNGARVRK